MNRSSPEPGLRFVTPAWIEAQQDTINELRHSRSNALAHAVLLLPAAQHPLTNGESPGPEFEQRLAAARDYFLQVRAENGNAEFLVSGNRHHDSKTGKTDRVALYDAAGRWLVDNGVPHSDLMGKEQIDIYRRTEGVYNGAAEIALAAMVFATNPRFKEAIYFCSPGQVSRAKMYALAFGLPVTVKVPENSRSTKEQFHAPTFMNVALQGLTRTIDPHGSLLGRATRDRIPNDGNQGTERELLPHYLDLPWYRSDA